MAGGQTGADRAALDWALGHNLVHGGWCPLGRLAEDGPIDLRYRLRETPSAEISQRTEWNVRDADGTVIFSLGPSICGGTLLAAELVRQYRKPWLHLIRERHAGNSGLQLRLFVVRHGIQVLNIAGPRASEEPEIGEFVRITLEQAWAGGQEVS